MYVFAYMHTCVEAINQQSPWKTLMAGVSFPCRELSLRFQISKPKRCENSRCAEVPQR